MLKTGKRDERKLALIGALLLLGVQKRPKRLRHSTILVSSGFAALRLRLLRAVLRAFSALFLRLPVLLKNGQNA